eukprot:79552-Rhodomonas_salina.1
MPRSASRVCHGGFGAVLFSVPSQTRAAFVQFTESESCFVRLATSVAARRSQCPGSLRAVNSKVTWEVTAIIGSRGDGPGSTTTSRNS